MDARRLMRRPMAALVACALGAPALSAQSLDDVGRRLYRSAAPAVFRIEMRDVSGQPLSSGTSFMVADDRLITNAHVVDEGRPYLKIGAVALPLTLVRTSERDDLAVLRSATPLEAQPLQLASDVPEEGTPVWVLANPQGLDRSLSSGIVSRVRLDGGTRLLQHTASISPGSSGGPVLDSEGMVVGVTMGAIETGQNLNFAVPVDRVRALLEAPVSELGPLPVPIEPVRRVPRSDLLEAQRRWRPALQLGVEDYQGELSPADPVLDSGSPYDDYAFTAEQPSVYYAKLKSADFDPVVKVVSLASGQWWEDDDGDVDDDACVRFSATSGERILVSASSFPWADTTAVGRSRGGWYTVEVTTSPCGVEDNRWAFLGTEGGAAWWVDVISPSRTGPGRVVTWVRSTYDRPDIDENGVGEDRLLEHREFDCSYRRARTLQRDAYLGSRLVDHRPSDDPVWESAAPESIDEKILDFVCAQVTG